MKDRGASTDNPRTMPGYTKLFSSILMSSIWEESAETRIVWVTLLALADQHGHIDGTVKSVARVARVPVKTCENALITFLSPDPDDRSGVADGRRIEVEAGGWRLVNYGTYRHRMSEDERRERDKMRKRAVRASAQSPQVSEFVRDVSQAEAEAEAEAKNVRTPSPKTMEPLDVAFQTFRTAYPANRRKGGRLVEEAYLTQATRAGGPDVLFVALQNHLASAQWRTPALIPGMNTWLNEERWRQVLEPDEAMAATGKPDMYGHFPRCANMQDCTRKALDEARAKKESGR